MIQKLVINRHRIGVVLYDADAIITNTWWRQQMEIFSTLLALCEGNPPVTNGFPSQRPVTRSFVAFFDLRLNKRLSKQPTRRWFETPSCSLWRHCNGGAWLSVCALITDSFHVANFDGTGGTINCGYDNLQHHQKRQSWHDDDSRFSVRFIRHLYITYVRGYIQWYHVNITSKLVFTKRHCVFYLFSK